MRMRCMSGMSSACKQRKMVACRPLQAPATLCGAQQASARPRLRFSGPQRRAERQRAQRRRGPGRQAQPEAQRPQARRGHGQHGRGLARQQWPVCELHGARRARPQHHARRRPHLPLVRMRTRCGSGVAHVGRAMRRCRSHSQQPDLCCSLRAGSLRERAGLPAGRAYIAGLGMPGKERQGTC